MTIYDVPALAALHVETFNETHGNHPDGPTVELRQYQWQKLFQEENRNWFCIVIENEQGKLVGFAKGQPYYHDDQPDYSGELNKIYILNKFQRLGLGRQLICKVAHQFVRRDIRSMLLFGNEESPSNRFYERMGADKLYGTNGEFNGGYGWKDLQKLINICLTLLHGN